MQEMILSDCLKAMNEIAQASVDALITDPPAGISFMGKEWDHHKGGRDQWVQWMSEVMRECYRVLKPGAHGLVWALPRTSHWTATALENAGFEIRDVVTHLFGTGFPKSLDISKAIDKAAGRELEVIGERVADDIRGGNMHASNRGERHTIKITQATSDEAKKWQGYGTALKPASEHWILIRKPLSEKTVAANVLKHGTGGINIDASRIGTSDKLSGSGSAPLKHGGQNHRPFHDNAEPRGCNQHAAGRFPANLVLSHNDDCSDECSEGCAVKMLDQFGDTGGASRFFYCAKASKSDRNEGLEGMPEKASRPLGISNWEGQTNGSGDKMGASKPQANHHPTVKSTKLMEYLIKLITPEGGTILDPFMGSGSTGVAAKKLGFKFVGIEREEEYFNIAIKRIEAAK